MKSGRVSIRLLPSAEGGRSTPIGSGYRSLLRFSGTETDYGFELDLDQEPLAPGEPGTGRVRIWALDDEATLEDGRAFEIREGAKIVGRGTVLGR